MASKRSVIPAKHLFNGFKHATQPKQLPHNTRSMATIASSEPATKVSQTYPDAHLTSTPTEPILQDTPNLAPNFPDASYRPANPFITTASVTLHAFPTLEPASFHSYPSTHLLLPLRRDVLHRAVIYEGDSKRQGSANTKWRSEVHGSNRKIRPQKGTGMARLGDKKSPMLRGGGVAFGPKPRNFATELNRKLYDLAWRTALSYRYLRGELLVVENEAEIPERIHKESRERWLGDMLLHNHMGKTDRRTLFVTAGMRERLFECLEKDGRHASAREVGDVDVKALLEGGKVCVEKRALDAILKEHESDLTPDQKLKAWEQRVLREV
jgi:large subunit ribosomal protein L4